MAQFMATIKGTKGEASRLGHKTTGIRATVKGGRTKLLVTVTDSMGGRTFVNEAVQS